MRAVRLCTHMFLLVALLLGSILGVSAQQGPEEIIIESCRTGQTGDLVEYGLTEEALDQLYWKLSYSGRLPWYARDGYSYYYDEETGLIQSFLPELLPQPEYDRAAYELAQQELLQAVLVEGMTPTQQALAIHDYLAASFCYDESETLYKGYDLLVRGTAVCEGYAEAYMDLLSRVGIPCVMVISEEMDHSWNLVQLDGAWYHVDVTWDDPTPDIFGQVLHTYFLVTDQEMEADHQERLVQGEEEGGHHSWDTDLLCTDTAYTQAYWKALTSQIVYIDAGHSLLLQQKDWDNYIYLREETTGELTWLCRDSEKYINIGQGEYAYTHLGMSLWENRIYYTDTNTAYSVALDGSDQAVLYRHDAQEAGSFIYGSFVKDDTLYLTLCDHDFEVVDTQEVPLPPTGYHIHSYAETKIPATCTQAGQDNYACACGITLELEGDAATGHHYTSHIQTEAGLWQEGSVAYTCPDCSDTYYKELPALGLLEWLFSLLAG